MKTQIQQLLIVLSLLAGAQRGAAQALDDPNDVLSYQGLLSRQTNDVGIAAYDMQFTLFPSNSGGSALAGPITNTAIMVNSNGLFATTMNFGSNFFTGGSYFLEVGVRTNGGSQFTILSPRQPVTATPQASYAFNAGTANIARSATNFVGAITGDVTGAQGATVVASVGGQTAANIANATIAANSATSANVPNMLVSRDGSGSFSAGSVTLGGSLNLPFPAIIYAGSNTVFVEEGSTFLGQNAFFPPGISYLSTGSGASPLTHQVGIGDSVLSSGSSGPYNTGIGEVALQYNTTGSNNTASGFGSLRYNTSGSNNKADGYETLYSNTTGFENTANGSLSMFANTTGYQNTANGGETLYSNTMGYWNTACGVKALYANTTGLGNTANGYQSLFSNTVGFQNVGDGLWSLYSNTNGNSNTGIGYESLYYNASGSWNTAVGVHALIGNTTGSSNIVVGAMSGANLTTGNNNIDIGNQGVAGEASTIRIGATNIHNSAYFAGIYGVNSANALPVVINAAGQLGTSASANTILSVPPSQPPSVIGAVPTLNTPEGMTVIGRYAYVVTFGGYLQIFDVNTPASPALLSTTSVGHAYSVAVAGRYAYVMTEAGMLEVLDVSDASAPVITGSVATSPSESYGYLTVAGAYVYTAGSHSIQIFDVDDPFHPKFAGSTPTANYTSWLAISGRYAYATEGGGTGKPAMEIFDVSTPTAPTLAGSFSDGGAAANSVAVSGRYAYLAENTKLQIIDVSNPNTTALPTSSFPVPGSTSLISITVGDRYAYMVDYVANGGLGLAVVNVSNPTLPVFWTSLATLSLPDAVTVSGRYAYVIDEDANELQVLDLGGGYIQHLEAGYTETGTLQVRDGATVGGALDVRGGLAVSASARIAGELSVFGNIDASGSVTANGVLLTSDRNAKRNFAEVDVRDVLAKVAALPVTKWNYRADGPEVRHIGPMAQDFQAAFRLSDDDKHISVVDEGGVALAAIQGLNEKVESESVSKDAEITALKTQLAEIKTLLRQMAETRQK